MIPKGILDIAGKKFDNGDDIYIQIYPVSFMKMIDKMLLFASDGGEEQFFLDEKGQVVMIRSDDPEKRLFAKSLKSFFEKIK
jgi:hypothetical protein